MGCFAFRLVSILGLYRGYMGIMEKKMETTIMGYITCFLKARPPVLFCVVEILLACSECALNPRFLLPAAINPDSTSFSILMACDSSFSRVISHNPIQPLYKPNSPIQPL